MWEKMLLTKIYLYLALLYVWQLTATVKFLIFFFSYNFLVFFADTETEAGSDSSFGRREKARRKMTAKTDMLYNDTDLGPELSLPPVLPSAKNFQRSQSFVKPSGHDMMVRSRSFVKPSGKYLF